MGTKEHCQAVADYLKHAGCDSVDGIFLGIGGVGAGASKSGVRAALKKLGAWGRKTGDWRQSLVEREAAYQRVKLQGVMRWQVAPPPHYPGIVEMFRLRPWEAAF
jgi:hypothetical protein